uniref:Uncharacterized protein n=1 Tax=Lepeophtheirus salmonis TaxID=72036 RepID=A0A0K2U4F1_LEPSM
MHSQSILSGTTFKHFDRCVLLE